MPRDRKGGRRMVLYHSSQIEEGVLVRVLHGLVPYHTDLH